MQFSPSFPLSGELKLSEIENIKLLPKGRSIKIHNTAGAKICFKALDQEQSRTWFLALLQHIQSVRCSKWCSSDERRSCDGDEEPDHSESDKDDDEEGIELSDRSTNRIASNITCVSGKSVRIVSDLRMVA